MSQEKQFEFFVNKINELPAFPAIVMELTRMIDNPMSSVNQIENLMNLDQGLTLKVLRLANSAYYAIPGGAKTLMRAITFVGFSTVKKMILTSTLFDMLRTKSAGEFDAREFWLHSANTAAVAELLCRQYKMGTPEDAFVCGLVHDMGKIVVKIVEPELLDRTCLYAKQNGISYEAAEEKLGPHKHSYWGHVLAQKWQLPQSIQSSVRDHHTERPGLRLTPVREINAVVDTVYLANQIVHNRETFKGKGHYTYTLEDSVLERNSITQESLQTLSRSIEAALVASEAFLEALGG